MSRNIVFVSGNAGKIREVKAIFGDGFNIVNYDIDLPEIQTTKVEEVIKEKIKSAITLLEAPSSEDFKNIKKEFAKIDVEVRTLNDIVVFCEDTGLYIDSLRDSDKEIGKVDFPGALIKFYFKAMGNKGIIARDGGSKARMECWVGAVIKGKGAFFTGSVDGKVPTTYKGEGSFGFDSAFIPKLPSEYASEQGKTYSELSAEIKNATSSRAKAVGDLKAAVSTGGGRKTKSSKLDSENPGKKKKSTKKTSKKRSKKHTGGGKKRSKKSSKKGSKKHTGGGKKRSKKSSKKGSKKHTGGDKKKSKKSSKKGRKH